MKRTTLSTLFIFLLLAGLAHQVAYAALFAGPAPTGPDPFENGGFESGTLEPWIHCGGVQLVDAQAVGTTPLMVHHGRYAAVAMALWDRIKCSQKISPSPPKQMM